MSLPVAGSHLSFLWLAAPQVHCHQWQRWRRADLGGPGWRRSEVHHSRGEGPLPGAQGRSPSTRYRRRLFSTDRPLKSLCLLSAQNNRLVTAGCSNTVQIHTFPEGEPDGILTRFTTNATHVAFNSSGSIVAAGSRYCGILTLSLFCCSVTNKPAKDDWKRLCTIKRQNQMKGNLIQR